MNKINYPHLASQLFNTPLMCTPQLRDSFQGYLLNRMQGGGSDISLDVSALSPGTTERTERVVEHHTHAGINIIPIHGALVTRGGGIDANCNEISSYEKASNLFDAAMNNDSVDEIILDMNTPGGAAVGCFDFADRIYQARGTKPVTALVNYHAYSAGYMIAAAADKIVVSSTSGVGSIGVIASHVDLSKAMDQAGLKISTFYRGHHKNDMTPYEPISDAAAATLDAELDELYEMFVDSVAMYRGMSTKAVKDTEAGLFRGAKAIEGGLADTLSYPQQAVDDIAMALSKQKASARSSSSSSRRSIGAQAASVALRARM